MQTSGFFGSLVQVYIVTRQIKCCNCDLHSDHNIRFSSVRKRNTRTIRFLEKGTSVKQLIELQKTQWQNDKCNEMRHNFIRSEFLPLYVFREKMTMQVSRFSENMCHAGSQVSSIVFTLLRKPRYTGIKLRSLIVFYV